MGQNNEREILSGHLTKKEQVAVGLILSRFATSEKKEGNGDERKTKRRVFRELGLMWVVNEADKRTTQAAEENAVRAERGLDPISRPLFSNAERSDELAPFTASRDSVSWVLDKLDKLHGLGGADEFVICDVEEYLADVKRGSAAPRSLPPGKMRAVESCVDYVAPADAE